MSHLTPELASHWSPDSECRPLIGRALLLAPECQEARVMSRKLGAESL